MKIRTIRFFLALLCLLLACIGGCSANTGEETANSPAPNSLPATNGGGDSNDQIGPDSDKTTDSSDEDTAQDTGDGNPEGADIPVETLPKIWVINVDDTQKSKMTMDGPDGPVTYDLTVTLKLWLTKGGDTPMGSYTGTALVKYEYSLDKGQFGGTAAGGGTDKEAKVELTDYDRTRFDSPEILSEDELAPLVKDDDKLTTLTNFETMALGILHLSGSGDVEEWTVNGGQYYDSGSGTQNTGLRIGIENGIATAYLPQISGFTTYMGTLSYQAQ